MWWEKKSQGDTRQDAKESSLTIVSPPPEPNFAPRTVDMPTANFNHTVVGRSMILHGELSGKEDLLIEGQFAGTINLQEHCVTVGAGGEVKAEVRARQVIVQGAVTGNISAGEKIEIRKTGHVIGDLVAAAVAIEDGAYFKGSIDIVREQAQPARAAAAVQSAYGGSDS